MSYIFKWNINKIIIYPFGGLIKYNDKIDKPLFEEFLVAIFGPINQIILYLIILILYKYNLIDNSYFLTYKNYHYSILLFNILPIIPLDGSKLLNIILNKFFNFKTSYNLAIIISYIMIVILVLNNYTNIVMVFLIYEIINSFKNRSIIFNKFVLEKYLYINKYKKRIIIDNIYKLKRNKKHIFKINNKYYTEKEYIKKRSITPNKV